MEERLDLDRFINDRNLERYRKLARAATSKVERQALFGSLAEENVKCFRLENAPVKILTERLNDRDYPARNELNSKRCVFRPRRVSSRQG
jgi:hypothetical protein